MSDIDPEKLEEAIKAALDRAAYDTQANAPYASGPNAQQHLMLACAAGAHLATLPRYEEVDVWRVEWAATGGVPCIDQHTDKSFVEQVAEEKRNFGRQCIRVTGPHKQRVPA